MFKKFQLLMHILKDNAECINALVDEKGWIHISVVLENTDITFEEIQKIYEKNKDKIQISEDKLLIRPYFKSKY